MDKETIQKIKEISKEYNQPLNSLIPANEESRNNKKIIKMAIKTAKKRKHLNNLEEERKERRKKKEIKREIGEDLYKKLTEEQINLILDISETGGRFSTDEVVSIVEFIKTNQ